MHINVYAFLAVLCINLPGAGAVWWWWWVSASPPLVGTNLKDLISDYFFHK